MWLRCKGGAVGWVVTGGTGFWTPVSFLANPNIEFVMDVVVPVVAELGI